MASLAGFTMSAQAPLSVPNGLPACANNIPDKVQPPSVEAAGAVHLPGSTKVYDASKTGGNANPPDWFPNEHGPAPRSVAGQGGVALMACGSCHLMSGQGHPESADIAGLPAEYIVRQMNYFKSGARKDDARMSPIAKSTSDEDTRQAAEYFAAIKPIPFVKVIETSYAAEDLREHRGAAPHSVAGGWDGADGTPDRPDTGRPVQDGESRSPFRVSGLRATGEHCERRGAGERRGRKNDSVRYLPRGRSEGPWRSAADRRDAAGVYLAAVDLHAERIERGHGGGPDEESGLESFRGRYYFDLRVSRVASTEVIVTAVDMVSS